VIALPRALARRFRAVLRRCAPPRSAPPPVQLRAGGTGLLTNAALVGRGLVKAGRAAAGGDLRAAGVEALAALVAPAALTCSAVATLVTEVVGGAPELADDALDDASEPLPAREAA
jgi:hypothetical protein